MYINTGYQITNTPPPQAAYNTWPYVGPVSSWYQHTPSYYIDNTGRVKEWESWYRPNPVYLPGGSYGGTPTRTGSYYVQNTIDGPYPQRPDGGCCCGRH